MNIAIVGAGFTGLTAAYRLSALGHSVTIFEKESRPGGLAIGFKESSWEWPLEKHYHHVFTSDIFIRKIADEMGLPFVFKRPSTSTLIEDEILQLDSPLKLLQFSKLSIIERLRMGIVLGYFRYIAKWQNLEQHGAHSYLKKAFGNHAYSMVWEPLLQGKFGEYYKDISLAWFWARIKARTTKLGYPPGGFQHLAETLAGKIAKLGGKIIYKTSVVKIQTENGKIKIEYLTDDIKKNIYFDRVLVTVPNILFSKITPELPDEYTKKLHSFMGIGAVNMVLTLKKKFLPQDVYWLNICEKKYPFIAVVEHTNFIDKKHYGDQNVLYVGNYLPQSHRYFGMSDEEIFKEYEPYLEKLHHGFLKNLIKYTVFRVPFAQPIVTRDFSRRILPFETPVKNIYLANMQQVYPWDRGTNFAVEMGEKAANYISYT